MTGGSLYPTGRQRLLLDDVVVTAAPGRRRQFKIGVDVEKYGSIPDVAVARLVVSESSLQRHVIELGGWRDLSSEVEFGLPPHMAGRFDARLLVACRQADRLGQLHATCEGLQVDTGDGPSISSPILPCRWDPDLEAYLWRFEVENGVPQVAFNQRLQEFPHFTSTGYFRSLVLPEVVRRVLEWLFLDADPTEQGSRAEEWLRLVCGGGQQVIDDFLAARQDYLSQGGRGLDDTATRKVETLVSSFCSSRGPVAELLRDLEQQ